MVYVWRWVGIAGRAIPNRRPNKIWSLSIYKHATSNTDGVLIGTLTLLCLEPKKAYFKTAVDPRNFLVSYTKEIRKST